MKKTMEEISNAMLEDQEKRSDMMILQNNQIDQMYDSLKERKGLFLISKHDLNSGLIPSNTRQLIHVSEISEIIFDEFKLWNHPDFVVNRYAALVVQANEIRMNKDYNRFLIIQNNFWNIPQQYARPFNTIENDLITNIEAEPFEWNELIRILTYQMDISTKIFIHEICKNPDIMAAFLLSLSTVYLDAWKDNEGFNDMEGWFDSVCQIIEHQNKNLNNYDKYLSNEILSIVDYPRLWINPADLVIFIEKLNKYYIYHHMIQSHVQEGIPFQGLNTFLTLDADMNPFYSYTPY